MKNGRTNREAARYTLLFHVISSFLLPIIFLGVLIYAMWAG
jgi:hypothetical protein